MMMGVYYNEFDPFAAAWLRELIKKGLIADGVVDERSIIDVQPDELREFKQCHFFAGIGGWSYALRLSGWPDDRPVWTGSCPCQPFSSAGNQKGKADERHLWPAWFNLIRECRPATVFGEQVASAVAHGWLDDVYQGLEAEGYACGSAVLPACSVGAPHKRDRLWFVANQPSARLPNRGESPMVRPCAQPQPERCGGYGDVGNSKHDGSPCGSQQGSDGQAVSDSTQGQDCAWQSSGTGKPCNVADTIGSGQQGPGFMGQPCNTAQGGIGQADRLDDDRAGHWQNGIWIDCPDGKQRLVEPSIRLLAYGVPNRVGKLRGYGNAIVPQTAATFIKAAM